jgi:hypothetical protein
MTITASALLTTIIAALISIGLGAKQPRRATQKVSVRSGQDHLGAASGARGATGQAASGRHRSDRF